MAIFCRFYSSLSSTNCCARKMEHAQKMVLVPQQAVEAGGVWQQDRPQEKSLQSNVILRTTQTAGTNLSRLDKDMSEILNSREIQDERERWKLYNQVLQRYLHFVDNAQNGKRSDNSVKAADAFSDITDSVISDTVPAKYKRKAVNLLIHLRPLRTSNHLTWDNKGVVTLDGETVKESNIIDLINEAMRERKAFNPKGKAQFAAFLRRHNIPREFIGNEKFWGTTENESTARNRLPGETSRRRVNSEPSNARIGRSNRARTLSDEIIELSDSGSDYDDAFADAEQTGRGFTRGKQRWLKLKLKS